jgi:large subunit ribosomal protein L29
MSNKNDFKNSQKDMSEADLKSRIEEDEMRLKKLKFAHSVSSLENPMTIRGVRKDLARLKTELKSKQLGSKS